MFAAAILDLHPEYKKDIQGLVTAIDLENEIELNISGYNDKNLSGTMVDVKEKKTLSEHSHRHYSQIKRLINNSGLTEKIKRHAIGIFDLLAQSESNVHGIPVDEVAFHEVGALDSIADIVVAAYLINKVGDVTWSCDPIPVGRGNIRTAHGILPLPAPAVVNLLEGYPVCTDEFDGERITPTGAAILRYINPDFHLSRDLHIAGKAGIGFGQKQFKGMSNILRVLEYKVSGKDNYQYGKVAQIEFELDDQTPEDIGVALDKLRSIDSVFDIVEKPVYAKKGRLAHQIKILCNTADVEAVARACFEQTTTLGLRWYIANRIVLKRDFYTASEDGNSIKVKMSQRPGGYLTAKAEIDDVREISRNHTERTTARDRAEKKAKADCSGNEDEQ